MFDSVNRHFSIRKEDRDVIFGMAIHVEEEKPAPVVDQATEDANAVEAYVLENSGTTIDDLIDIDEQEAAKYGVESDEVDVVDDADDVLDIGDDADIKDGN